jgi:putative intracellular protease/amidase
MSSTPVLPNDLNVLTLDPQPEMAHPYHVLAPHCQITVASPKGGEAPLDPGSVEAFKSDAISTEFLKHPDLWKKTEKLSSFLGRADEFDAIFYVGGHGPMFDLATDATSHKLINEFHEKNKVISAVCHGPAALSHVKLSDGSGYLLDGQRVTGFSNEEEDMVQLTSLMPFSLEDELNRASGGHFEKADKAWGEKVVVSRGGKLVTGQNPASATGVGKAILDAIQHGGKATKKDEI